MYLIVYFGSIIAFFIVNFVMRGLFTYVVNKKVWGNKSDIGKQRYLEKWTSNIHHVIIIYFNYYNFKN